MNFPGAIAFLAVSALMPFRTAPASAAQTGAISGRVIDESGTGIGAASVSFNNVPPYELSSDGRYVQVGPKVNSAVRTATDGSFLITGLPPGVYHLCASGTKANHLRTCEWTQPTRRIELTEGADITDVTFQVVEGTLVTFFVTDPLSRISDFSDLLNRQSRIPLSSGNFRVGIIAGTRYTRAEMSARTANGRQYQVAIPRDVTVRVALDTTLNVVDCQTGLSAVWPSTGRPIVPAGQPEVTVSLEVQ